MNSNISKLLNWIDWVENINEIIDEFGFTIEETKEKVKVLLWKNIIKTDLLKRCIGKLVNISEKVWNISIIGIISLIKNKEKFLDIIDSCDDVKLSDLINYSDPIKLAHYINSKKRSEIIDEIQRKTTRKTIKWLAKKIDSPTIPVSKKIGNILNIFRKK